MAPNQRNMVVGATVLVSLIALAWMVVRFGYSLATPFAPSRIPIQFIADRADGLAEGSPVLYRGVIIGLVEGIRRGEDNVSVVIDAVVDDNPPPPENVTATIRIQSLIGSGAALALELSGPEPIGSLRPFSKVDTKFGGLDLLPPEFTSLASEMESAVRQFRESNVVDNLNTQVTEVGKMVTSIRDIVGDEALVTDLKTSIENIRVATEKANTVLGRFDDFGGKLNDLSVKADKIAGDADAAVGDVRTAVASANGQITKVGDAVTERLAEISGILEQVRSVTAKVDAGEGTVGLLVNDPRLYQALVDSARKLDQTVATLNRLTEQWEQEGVRLKVR